jgi:hypothetical protein
MLTPVEAPVRVSVSGCEPDGAGRWRVTWMLVNLLDEPLKLEDAWLPHGRFRGEGHVALDAALPVQKEYSLTLGVSASSAPGAVVENAFLIVRLRAADEGWRVFARMRITFSDDASPLPVIEAVTAQRL